MFDWWGETFLEYYEFGAAQRSLTLPDVDNGTGYFFTLYAWNAVGRGNATYLDADPGPPAPVTAPGAPGVAAVSAGNGAVTVRWTPPSTDGGSPVTGYTVRAYKGTSLAKSVVAAAGATSATVGGLVNGTAYTLSVAAANAAGAGPESARSAAVTPAAPTVPGTPVLGVPVAGNGAVTVRWTAPSVTGGSPVTGYTVRAYRGTSYVKAVWAPASATSVTVGGLVNGTGYTFTVAASNAVGAGSESARTATVTPRTRPGVVPPAGARGWRGGLAQLPGGARPPPSLVGEAQQGREQHVGAGDDVLRVGVLGRGVAAAVAARD